MGSPYRPTKSTINKQNKTTKILEHLLDISESGWDSLLRESKVEFLIQSIEILGWIVSSSGALGSPSKENISITPSTRRRKKKKSKEPLNSQSGNESKAVKPFWSGTSTDVLLGFDVKKSDKKKPPITRYGLTSQFFQKNGQKEEECHAPPSFS